MGSDAEKVRALEHLLAWNYDFAPATCLAEHGTIEDFWDRVLMDYAQDKIPEPRYHKIKGTD